MPYRVRSYKPNSSLSLGATTVKFDGDGLAEVGTEAEARLLAKTHRGITYEGEVEVKAKKAPAKDGQGDSEESK